MAWENTEKQKVTAADLQWFVEKVALPPRDTLKVEELRARLHDSSVSVLERKSAARNLAWLLRCQSGETIDLTMLKLGSVRIVNLPGEAVVEYQLAAQEFGSDRFVAVGGYTDYGPGYICLKEHYSQGGYEDSPGASRVAPEVEDVLMPAIQRLLIAGD